MTLKIYGTTLLIAGTLLATALEATAADRGHDAHRNGGDSARAETPATDAGGSSDAAPSIPQHLTMLSKITLPETAHLESFSGDAIADMSEKPTGNQRTIDNHETIETPLSSTRIR